MRKLILALSISLVLSLVFGGVMVLAASQAEPGNPLYPINQGLDAAVALLQDTDNAGDMQTVGVSAMDDTPQILDDEGDDTSVDDPLDDGDDLDDGDFTEDPKGPKDGAYCREGGKTDHPTMEKLAQRYSAAGASYDSIKKLFCEGGFGFGEIDLGYRIYGAYVIANPETEMELSEIFRMRTEDKKGWGQIIKELELDKLPKKVKVNGNDNVDGNANGTGNGNAYDQNNNQGNGNAGGNGNAYGKAKNANKGNKGGKGKP